MRVRLFWLVMLCSLWLLRCSLLMELVGSVVCCGCLFVSSG